MLAVAAMLASCGGGGSASDSGGTGTVVVPPAPPPPPPPPSPPATGAIGLTQQDSFETLSWLYRTSAVGEADGAAQIGFGFDRTRQQSTMTLPGVGVRYLEVFASETDENFGSAFLSPSGGTAFSFLRPGPQNRVLSLTSTSVGYFASSTYNGSPRGDFSGVIGYGVPSPASDFIEFSSGSYRLHGFAVVRPDGAGTDGQFHQLLGNVAFPVSGLAISGNFATGTVSGYFPNFTQLPERFAFSTLGYSGTRFYGTLSVTGGATGAGTFDGFFTGPLCDEVLIRWSAPYRDSATGRVGTIYGVLAGRRG